MALRDPEELKKEMSENIGTLRGTQPLDPETRRRMAEDLADVFNYIADVSSRRGGVNILHRQSAVFARNQAATASALSDLRDERHFVEDNLDKADQYLRTIQLAGYAAFFAALGFSREHIDDIYFILAMLLMIFSATAFVAWEIWKGTLVTLSLRRNAKAINNLEKFVQDYSRGIVEKNTTIEARTRQRAVIWLICVSTASVSILILFLALICTLF